MGFGIEALTSCRTRGEPSGGSAAQQSAGAPPRATHRWCTAPPWNAPATESCAHRRASAAVLLILRKVQTKNFLKEEISAPGAASCRPVAWPREGPREGRYACAASGNGARGDVRCLGKHPAPPRAHGGRRRRRRPVPRCRGSLCGALCDPGLCGPAVRACGGNSGAARRRGRCGLPHADAAAWLHAAGATRRRGSRAPPPAPHAGALPPAGCPGRRAAARPRRQRAEGRAGRAGPRGQRHLWRWRWRRHEHRLRSRGRDRSARRQDGPLPAKGARRRHGLEPRLERQGAGQGGFRWCLYPPRLRPSQLPRRRRVSRQSAARPGLCSSKRLPDMSLLQPPCPPCARCATRLASRAAYCPLCALPADSQGPSHHLGPSRPHLHAGDSCWGAARASDLSGPSGLERPPATNSPAWGCRQRQ
jgi:hypothetical protein